MPIQTKTFSPLSNKKNLPYLFLPGYLENLSCCWESFLKFGEKKIFKKEEEIPQNNSIYYISKGLIKNVSKENNGSEKIFFIGEQCILEEQAFLYDSPPSRINICVADSVLYRFSYEVLQALLKKDTAGLLSENMLFSLNAKHTSEGKLKELRHCLSSSQCIAFFLYGCFLRAGRKTRITSPLSQNMIAQLLGITPNTVARIAGTWKKEGIISEWSENSLEISNIERIKEKFSKKKQAEDLL